MENAVSGTRATRLIVEISEGGGMGRILKCFLSNPMKMTREH